MKVTQLGFIEGSTKATPANGQVSVYAKSDGLLYSLNDTGTESVLGGGTVSSVTSANADITITNPTTTPVITMVQAPALRTASTTVSVSSATAPTNGQVLTATSSTTANWQTPAAGSGTFPKFQASSNDQLFSSGVRAKADFTIEDFDTNNNFASGRFTPTVDGYYYITFIGYFADAAISSADVDIYKNGTFYASLAQGFDDTALVGAIVLNAGILISLNGSGDYVEMFPRATTTDSSTIRLDTISKFQGFKVA